MRALLLALAVCACAARPAPHPVVERTCPAGAPLPPVPAKPRTVQQVADWGNAVARALAVTEAARAECARRLWVATKKNPP